MATTSPSVKVKFLKSHSRTLVKNLRAWYVHQCVIHGKFYCDYPLTLEYDLVHDRVATTGHYLEMTTKYGMSLSHNSMVRRAYDLADPFIPVVLGIGSRWYDVSGAYTDAVGQREMLGF